MPFTRVQVPGLASWFQAAPAVLAPPASTFADTVSGQPLAPNAWTNEPQVDLGAALPAGASRQLAIEAEFVPEQQPLVGVPNVTGNPGRDAVVSPDMEPGQAYHWALRLRQAGVAASPWVRYSGTIGYQPTAPAAPILQPLPHDGWTGAPKLQLSWQADTDPAGIAGFAYVLDQKANGVPPASAGTTARTTAITIPKDGDWYFHLRSLDNAGNASNVTTLPIHFDSVPLSLQPPKFKLDGAWNPALGPLAIQVKASKAAQLTLAVLPEASDTPVRSLVVNHKAGATTTMQWDGKDDNGNPVAPGNYRLRLNATDKAGRTAQVLAQDSLALTNKRIVVSLSQQRMWAFAGDKPVFDTLVTTGGPELPTPVGTYHILSKLSPFTFHSPWPKGSPYWYADSPTSYAMLFESSGYFIHDAPWRSSFGPGSNVHDGTPGGNGTGTHGCVNVPLGVQTKLFAWTDVGTPVVVQP